MPCSVSLTTLLLGVKKVAPKAGLKKGPMPGGPKKAPVAPLPLSSDTGAADSRGGILDAIKNQEVNLKPVVSNGSDED